jgi:hypothetical protein
MFFEWTGRPVPMIPTLAYTVRRPGGAWERASADRLSREARPITEREFWSRFGSWGLPDFPVAFSQIDRRRTPPSGPPAASTARPWEA